MLDAAKYADLVLLLVDGAFGFEMETFEFLNILQVSAHVVKSWGSLVHNLACHLGDNPNVAEPSALYSYRCTAAGCRGYCNRAGAPVAADARLPQGDGRADAPGRLQGRREAEEDEEGA